MRLLEVYHHIYMKSIEKHRPYRVLGIAGHRVGARFEQGLDHLDGALVAGIVERRTAQSVVGT